VTATYVVDSSVAAKWFFDEDHSNAAEALRSGVTVLIAPDLLAVELGSAAVQKVRRGQASEDIGRRVAAMVGRLPVKLFESAPLVADAFALALAHHPSVYDCLYLALALREGCRLVTADRRFYDAVAAAFPETVMWIEELPAESTDAGS
jgi:predicted nucleic acid-binding protein